MLRFAFFALLIIAPFAAAQNDPSDSCYGQDDGYLAPYGHEFSCTKYYYCQGDYGYEEDCVEQYGEGFEFNENTLECDYDSNVNCAAYGGGVDPVYPDPDYTDPITDPPPPPPVVTDAPTQPPVTRPPGPQTPSVTNAPTTSGPLVPDVTCPTNRPSEILFFPSSNCSEYFICANGNRMSMVCMEGFTWNQDAKQCDFPIFSTCSQNIVDDGLTVRCTRTGFYTTAYPRNCEKFVFCSLGIPMVQNCPIGHAWNIDRCIERRYASCPDGRRIL